MYSQKAKLIFFSLLPQSIFSADATMYRNFCPWKYEKKLPAKKEIKDIFPYIPAANSYWKFGWGGLCYIYILCCSRKQPRYKPLTLVCKCNITVHGLRTPNEGINQRILKFEADVADKICFNHIYKFGIGILFLTVQWRGFPYRAFVVRVTVLGYMHSTLHGIW